MTGDNYFRQYFRQWLVNPALRTGENLSRFASRQRGFGFYWRELNLPEAFFMKRQKTDNEPELTPEQLAENWLNGLLTTARRAVAVRTAFPTARVKYRRAARTGDKANVVLLLIIPADAPPRTEIWSLSKLDGLAEQVSTEAAYDELRRWTYYEE